MKLLGAICLLLMCVACDPEPEAWKVAQEQNNIAALESYLKDYPDSLHTENARSILNSLVDTRDWETAVSTAEIQLKVERYQAYVNEHPDGEFFSDAKTNLNDLVYEQAWSEATSISTSEIYAQFAERFAESSRAEEAIFRSELAKAAEGYVGIKISFVEEVSWDNNSVTFKVKGPFQFGGRALGENAVMYATQAAKNFIFLGNEKQHGDTMYSIGGEAVQRFVALMPFSLWTWLGGYERALAPLPLHESVLVQDIEKIEAYLASGASVDVTDVLGRTALFYAIEHAAPDNHGAQIVQTLIDAGADVRKSGLDGKTPLMLAFQQEKLELGKLLLENGADVSVKLADKMTVLHYAALLKADAGFFQKLAADNPNIDLQRDLDLATPLHMAVLANNLNAVQGLLDAGADANASGSGIRNALELAKAKEYTEIQSLLESY